MALVMPAIAIAISRVEELGRGRHYNLEIHNLEIRVCVEVPGRCPPRAPPCLFKHL
jgi:hypothetical protein